MLLPALKLKCIISTDRGSLQYNAPLSTSRPRSQVLHFHSAHSAQCHNNSHNATLPEASTLKCRRVPRSQFIIVPSYQCTDCQLSRRRRRRRRRRCESSWTLEAKHFIAGATSCQHQGVLIAGFFLRFVSSTFCILVLLFI